MGTPYFCAQMVASAMPLASAVRTTVILLVSKYLANSSAMSSSRRVSTRWLRKPSTLTMLQDSALAADALLKKLHGITPPEKIISDEIFRLKW